MSSSDDPIWYAGAASTAEPANHGEVCATKGLAGGAVVCDASGTVEAVIDERAAPRFAHRSLITPTMREASLPTPWIIVDDMAC